MSAANRVSSRLAFDHYPTPAWAIPLGGRILDAGCGEGAILASLVRYAPDASFITGIELQEKLAVAAQERFRGHENVLVICGDYLTMPITTSYDLVIGNPPFSMAVEFLKKSWALTEYHHGTVALLLRLDWLAPLERGDLLDARPPDVNILDRRPHFRMGVDGKRGSDSCEYMWAVWRPSGGGRWKRLRCARPERRGKKPVLEATCP